MWRWRPKRKSHCNREAERPAQHIRKDENPQPSLFLDEGVKRSARHAGGDRIARFELRGIFDEISRAVEDQRVTALENLHGRERFQPNHSLCEAAAAVG